MNLTIRKARPDDFQLLSEIGRTTFYETWRPVNTEEDMQSYMQKSFDPSKIKADIAAGTANTFFLAFAGDVAIGYCKMRCDRTYDEFKNEPAIEIERIYVLKSWHGKKAGKALMDRCIEYAEQQKYSWLWLGVNIDNVTAIDFYKKYGFTIFGEKSFQLGEAVDNDYLMKRRMIG
jgi:diamine N-acetyltransferase